MPLVDPALIIAQAARQGTAVVGANVSTWQMAHGAAAASAQTGRPLLLQFNRSGLELIGGAALAALTAQTLAAAEELADAQIALHLDHADTLQELSEAINHQFHSVMIDGSTLPYPQHVGLVQEAKGLTAWSRTPLEAELGHVAGTEAGVTIGAASWTDPDEAAQFVQATGVDWLAVAVGNTHGGKAEGGLQVDRLRAIRAVVKIPLVLHGASGLTDAELEQAAALGVAKINVGTSLHQAAAHGLAQALQRSPANLRAALQAAEAAVAEATAQLLTADWAYKP